MNFTEIVQLIADYSNRNDTDTLGQIPNFVILAEARMNRDLRAYDMTERTAIAALAPGGIPQKLYDIGTDTRGLREVEYNTTDGKKKSLVYISPARMNAAVETPLIGEAQFYTIIDNQIQIVPNFESPNFIEYVAYMKVDPLATAINNWVSDLHPDLYLYGCMSELMKYIKNVEMADYWLKMMGGVYEEIKTATEHDRWIGADMQVRSDTRIGQSNLSQGRGGR